MAFIGKAKAYDKVNKNQLLEVMRGYGVQENLVDIIERIDDGSVIKVEIESAMNGWCKIGSVGRQGCSLSLLLF